MAMRSGTGALWCALACSTSCGGGDPAPAVIGEVRGAPLFVPGDAAAEGAVEAPAAVAVGEAAEAAGGATAPTPASGVGEPSDASSVAAPDAAPDAALSAVGEADDDPEAAGAASDLGVDYEDLLSPEEATRYEWVDFATLTDFEFPGFLRTDGEVTAPDLPEEVTALDGRLVAVEGFMNPMMFDADGVSEFTLVADPQFCCFGATPQLNHFLYVTLADDERCEFYSIVPLAVYGRLSIGAEEEDGLVLSLYRLEADHVFCVY
ncbi:MAG: hypothetical protein CMJ84_01085 [Planctomycetes bacterium]|jgi:hypothetical protein|nr:hypothetical protein [Planctomycetota bacterium]MDP6408331.1 DUF3299 domain-containing protein [Planctomycetota bacterium]